MKIKKQRLEELKNSFSGKKIIILGDMMLDVYMWGDVKRISPEAPVPIVEIDNEFYRFGGAANVVLNIQTLGAIPIPIGIIGTDSNAEIFKSLLVENNITTEFIFTDSSRPTTCKTRVISSDQHIVRIDKESKKNISREIEAEILAAINRIIPDADAVILQDYNKGVLTKSLINNTIDIALKHNKFVTVDPKFNNFREYKSVTLFKPNRKETEDAFGIRIQNEEDLFNAAGMIFQELGCKYLMITLGDKGSIIFDGPDKFRRFPTIAKTAVDVSGAGDTVIATLTTALTAGAEIEEAAFLSNFAGGMVCEIPGVVPIKLEQLFNEISEYKNE